jgi:probable F420-dependent oxidoreductase
MRVDGSVGFDPDGIARQAKAAEEDGYDAVWSPETGHDPFFPLLLASQHSQRLDLGTGIAVAFARNPMNMAILANDMQMYSKGRFMLGLGSQIKPHIEKRFSMPWSHPAARMREFVLALRAIWGSWRDGTKLEFRGEFYTHTLMNPFFNPGPNPYGAPKVFVAGVGELMTEVAGEVADGILVHGFTTESYLREVTMPALLRGLAKAGKSRLDVQEVAAAAGMVKAQIAFYGSTPAYKPVLDHHGWGDLQLELNTLSKRGEWGQMAGLIDDEMMATFAVVAPVEGVADGVLARFSGTVDRFSFYAPYHMERERWRAVVAGLKGGS